MLRIPKELHKQLIEAAKENGVSLNQYALYKLAKKTAKSEPFWFGFAAFWIRLKRNQG